LYPFDHKEAHMILSAEHIAKAFPGRTLLRDASLFVEKGDRIGILGRNGAGKSTLLRMLAGLEPPDAGKITRGSGARISYLPQNPEFPKGSTIVEAVFAGVSESERELKSYEAMRILTRLGFSDENALADTLSGGQKKKLALAAALLCPCEALLLDEPTNHLDTETAEWLEKQLAAFKGALVLVTHDRYFLERVVNQIVELEDGALYTHPANYSAYLERKAEREEMAQASERKRQAILKKELAWMRRGARARSTKAKGRIERFEQLSSIQAPVEQEEVRLHAASSRLGRKIIEIENVSKGFNGRTLIRDFSYVLLRDDRVGIIGPNGCGKSTLLHLIDGSLEPDAGAVVRGETVKLGCFAQDSAALPPEARAIDVVKDVALAVETDEGRLTATQMMERFLFDTNLQYTPVNRLSGGEKRRLYLLTVLMSAPNVLLLDEPTNDLDIQTLAILEDYLDSFPGAVIAVSHDRYFLDRIAQRIFVYEGEGRIRQYPGGYSDYVRLREEPEPQSEKPLPKKEEPQREKREKKVKFTFREQREFETIDADVERAEEALQEIERQMEAAQADYVELERLSEEKERAQANLDALTERWVYLHDLHDQMEAEHNG
jgi:ATP-binding cassette subfamily F protein uup